MHQFTMTVHTNIQALPVFNNALITIGTFDGVHGGHQQIIQLMKAEAAKIAGETIIITFHPHPRKVIGTTPGPVYLLNTLDEKIDLLEKYGIDHLVVVPFTEAFASQDAESYIKDFLVSTFHPHTIIIGYDHRFGKERKGDYLLLEKLAPVFNYQLKEIPKHVLEEISISSTRIREALLNGKIEIADKLLGYEFFFSGTVVHGDKLGRKLGYPTANLKMNDDEKIIPHNGIYAVYGEVRSQNSELRDSNEKGNSVFDESPDSPLTTHHSLLKGMMSIGFRPTVDGKKRVIEVNLFDFAEEIYDRTLRVYVKKYLREEIKFDSLDELVKQIDQDKIDSLNVL